MAPGSDIARPSSVAAGQDGRDEPAGAFWWALPALGIGLLRPGLREAVLADSFRLRQLPAVIGAIVLPTLAIGLPVLLSILQAGTPPNDQPIPDAMTITIYDVFTESLPFMVAAFLIGLASPAAGALLVVLYGVGNLVVTAISGELEPPLAATYGRLVAVALLWLLVVEIPLLARVTVEWAIQGESATMSKRWVGIIVGAGVVAALAYAWAQAAPTLITIVYWTTAAWGGPFLAAVQPLQQNDLLFAGVAAAGGVLLLAIRYLGQPVVLTPAARRSGLSRLPGGSVGAYVLSVGAGLALLSGVISSPIDAAVLVVGLVAARPLARLVLSATRLAAPLAQLAGPVRLVLGFGAAAATGWVVLSVLGVADWSRFSTAVIAIAISVFVVALFTEADQVARQGMAPKVDTPMAATTLGGVLLLAFLVLAFPGAVLADNCGDQSDCWTEIFRTALAVAGSAVLVAQIYLVPFLSPGPRGTPSHRDEASPYGKTPSSSGGQGIRR